MTNPYGQTAWSNELVSGVIEGESYVQSLYARLRPPNDNEATFSARSGVWHPLPGSRIYILRMIANAQWTIGLGGFGQFDLEWYPDGTTTTSTREEIFDMTFPPLQSGDPLTVAWNGFQLAAIVPEGKTNGTFTVMLSLTGTAIGYVQIDVLVIPP